MKLPIIIAAGTLTAAIAYNAYALTCGAQPSCADLGYTLTSTDDCIGTPLKCPFDKTKYNCVKKAEVANLLAPDYSHPKTLNAKGTLYTLGSGDLAEYSCGWVLFRSENTNPKDTFSFWYINNKVVGKQNGFGGLWADNNAAIFFLGKGDSFNLNGTATSDYLFFFPCKGY